MSRDDLKAGWLEKRTGESSSLASLPVNSWKWQRRCRRFRDWGVGREVAEVKWGKAAAEAVAAATAAAAAMCCCLLWWVQEGSLA